MNHGSCFIALLSFPVTLVASVYCMIIADLQYDAFGKIIGLIIQHLVRAMLLDIESRYQYKRLACKEEAKDVIFV